MKIINPNVEILTPLDGRAVLQHIERCGRVCYKSEDKITDTSAAAFVAGIIKRGHEAVLEHFDITVKFICDRGVSHEIVRHRLASYCQESTRYVASSKRDCAVNSEDDVLYAYNEAGLSMKRIADRSNDKYSEYDVSEILRKHNATIREHGRRGTINSHYFETIDTPEKAFLLGFIMADGAVCKTDKGTKSDSNRLYINISDVDKELLNTLCDDLNYDRTQVKSYIPNGSTYSNNKMCKLNINSTKICEDLKKYGIIKQKTGKEKFVLLDDALMPHFIRGFFDGDGTVYNTYQNGPRITHVGFSGNYIFLNNLKTYLKKQGIIKNDNKITQEKRNNCNCCSYSFANKKDIKSFFDYIYKDATVFLERKHNKFL